MLKSVWTAIVRAVMPSRTVKPGLVTGKTLTINSHLALEAAMRTAIPGSFRAAATVRGARASPATDRKGSDMGVTGSRLPSGERDTPPMSKRREDRRKRYTPMGVADKRIYRRRAADQLRYNLKRYDPPLVDDSHVYVSTPYVQDVTPPFVQPAESGGFVGGGGSSGGAGASGSYDSGSSSSWYSGGDSGGSSSGGGGD